jgi:EAL domain-containing protein (putative c-di-GMP-specific phosphodiesterase class I)
MTATVAVDSGSDSAQPSFTWPAFARATPSRAAAEVDLRYQPILDLVRGTTAGYQVQRSSRRLSAIAADSETAATVAASLAVAATLPPGVFVAVPIPVQCAAAGPVHAALKSESDLTGVVLDIIGFDGTDSAELDAAIARYRCAGALISVGGDGAAQPELSSIARLKPAVIRLGREWVRGIEQLDAKRATIEVIGRLAAQLRARILCEGVASETELQILADLGVALAQGPFIGNARRLWSGIHPRARAALPQHLLALPVGAQDC